MAHDSTCIFCKILNGEIPSHKVYEDSDFLAFLDIHPQSAGHVQIIPKDHYRWVWDVPEDKIGSYFAVAQKIALAQKKTFAVDAVWSKVMGDEVPHAHIWVFPNPYELKEKAEAAGHQVPDPKDFEANAQKIKSAL